MENIMRKLLFTVEKKDFDISYFSGSGAGGQHRNKHKNCVRLKHKDSGAIATGQSHKSRKQNLREALHNIVKVGKFKMWHSQKVREKLDGITLDEKVDKMMQPENLRIEGRNKDGKWEPIE